MEIAALEQTGAQLEQQIAVAQESLSAVRQRREDAVQASSQRVARVAALEERHRSATAVLGRIESLFGEMSERIHALVSQIEAAAAEKLQRERLSAEEASGYFALVIDTGRTVAVGTTPDSGRAFPILRSSSSTQRCCPPARS